MKKHWKKIRSLVVSLVLAVAILPTPSLKAQEVFQIDHPVAGDRTTSDYVVRFRVPSAWLGEEISLTYLNKNGADSKVLVDWSEGTEGRFTKLLKDLAPGTNKISLSVDGALGHQTQEVDIEVAKELHPIMNPVNRLTAKQMKRALKVYNGRAAAQYGRVPKTDEYIDEFVDCLIKNAALEGINADIAFAQIALETGWINYTWGVKENQNNFGGIGATGGPVRGNAFRSMEEGIQANLQHLIAYATDTSPVTSLVDPRFYYVPRANAPNLEELGYYENTKGGGWAMGSQYGFVIKDIIDLVATYADDFSPLAADGIITEIVAEPIEPKANPRDIRPGTGFDLVKPIRLAIAVNDWTLQSFSLRNLTTGQEYKVVDTTDRAILVDPFGPGIYRFTATIKDPASRRVIDNQTIEFTIKDPNAPDNPDLLVIPEIAGVTYSEGPHFINEAIEMTIAPADEATARTNEYVLEYVVSGTTDYQNWQKETSFRFTPTKGGEYLIRLFGRNSLAGGDGILLREDKLQVIAVDTQANLSKDSIQVGEDLVLTILPQAPEGLEYAVVDESGASLSPWGSDISRRLSFSQAGLKTISLLTRRQGQEAVLDKKEFRLTVQAAIGFDYFSLSTKDLVQGEPVKVEVAGGSDELEYRLYLGQGSLSLPLTSWQASPSFTWTPNEVGSVTLRLRCRDKNSKVEGMQAGVVLNVSGKSIPLDGPAGYLPENPYGIGKPLTYVAGIKAANHPVRLMAKTSTSNVLFKHLLKNTATGEIKALTGWQSGDYQGLIPAGSYQWILLSRHKDSRGFYDGKIVTPLRIYKYPSVMLDPGHGGSDRGVVVTKNGKTRSEAYLMLDLANRIKENLSGRGINVRLTRTSSIDMTLDERISLANSRKADLFLSLHSSASSDQTKRGLLLASPAQKVAPLAGVDINKSVYYREKLRSPLAAMFGGRVSGLTDYSAFGYYLRTNRMTNLPSLWLRLGYLSNDYDWNRLTIISYRESLAKVMADAIYNSLTAAP